MKATKWKIGLLSLVLSATFTFNSFAEWQQAQDGSWKFYNVDGTIGINKWAKSGEDWYHFDNEGNMEHSAIVVDGDGTYYVDDAGKMVKNQWVNQNGNYYYAGEDGKIVKDTVTPDGYTVDGNGVWNQSIPQKQKAQLLDFTKYSYTNGFERDSVDGITATWFVTNNTGKTINYYSVFLAFMNPVGHPAHDEITGKSTKEVKYVGPVKPGEELGIYNNVGYIPALEKIVIVGVGVEYSDGTKEVIDYSCELYEVR